MTRPQDDDEQRRAYQARRRAAQIFQFAMLTGARHSEITRLQWKDVDWETGRVIIFQTKTDRFKQIPITDALRELLGERKAEGRLNGFLFSDSGEINPKFYCILRKACEVCGIPYGQRTQNGVVLHTARHTVTTRLIHAGLDFDTVGQITGHTAKELIAHYTHHTPASMARAADALDAIGRRSADADKASDDLGGMAAR